MDYLGQLKLIGTSSVAARDLIMVLTTSVQLKVWLRLLNITSLLVMVEGIASISRTLNHWHGRRVRTAENDVFTIKVVHNIQEYGTSHYVDLDMRSLFQTMRVLYLLLGIFSREGCQRHAHQHILRTAIVCCQ
jgi:hypothetical protein